MKNRLLAASAIVGAVFAIPDATSAQDFRLGNETRARKLSLDTVAGRRITLASGRQYTYRRDGTFSIQDDDGDRYTGNWSIAHQNVIDMVFSDGDTQQLFYVTVDGKLYLRNAEVGGRLGRRADSFRVVRIEAAN